MEELMAGQSKRGLSASKSRSNGMKGAKAAASRKRPATQDRPAPQISGEKAVRETRATMPVKPLNISREAKRPIDGRAIDRRKQVFDDPVKGR
jgi:hypothetical protein